MNLPNIIESNTGTLIDTDKVFGCFSTQGSAASRFGSRTDRNAMPAGQNDFSQVMDGIPCLFKAGDQKEITIDTDPKNPVFTLTAEDLLGVMNIRGTVGMPAVGKAVPFAVVPTQSFLPGAVPSPSQEVPENIVSGQELPPSQSEQLINEGESLSETETWACYTGIGVANEDGVENHHRGIDMANPQTGAMPGVGQGFMDAAPDTDAGGNSPVLRGNYQERAETAQVVINAGSEAEKRVSRDEDRAMDAGAPRSNGDAAGWFGINNRKQSRDVSFREIDDNVVKGKAVSADTVYAQAVPEPPPDKMAPVREELIAATAERPAGKAYGKIERKTAESTGTVSDSRKVYPRGAKLHLAEARDNFQDESSRGMRFNMVEDIDVTGQDAEFTEAPYPQAGKNDTITINQAPKEMPRGNEISIMAARDTQDRQAGAARPDDGGGKTAPGRSGSFAAPVTAVAADDQTGQRMTTGDHDRDNHYLRMDALHRGADPDGSEKIEISNEQRARNGKVVFLDNPPGGADDRPLEARKASKMNNYEAINKLAYGDNFAVRSDRPTVAGNSEGVFPYQSVLNQVREGMTAGFKDGGRVRITLYPESLGRVDMEIVVRQDRVDLIMKVDNSDVHQFLSGRMDDLKTTLQNQGWQVNGVDVMLQKQNNMNDGGNFSNMFSWQERMNRDRNSGGMAGGRSGNRSAGQMGDISAAVEKSVDGTMSGLSIFA